MKTKSLLIAAVMFFGLTAAAFAQATFTVGSIPVTAVVATGQTERTGDITFSYVSGTSNAGTITVSYGVPITVALGSLTLTGTGGFAGATLNSVSNTGGQVVINVPAGATSGTIVLQGVRVAVAGSGLTSLAATLSSVGNAIVAGQTTVTVINSIQAGLASFANNTTWSVVNSVTGAVTGVTNLRAREGFLSAFGNSTDTAFAPAGLGAGFRVRLSALPPAGVTFTFPAAIALTVGSFSSVDCTTGAGVGAPTFTSTSTSLAACYRVSSSTSDTAQENADFAVAVTTAGAPSTPYTPGTITATASMAIEGTAFTSGGAVIATPLPRYAALEVGLATIVEFRAPITTLLLPFATRVAASGFDTGIAISNSSRDPGAAAMGLPAGATPQGGTVRFWFYPAQAAGAAAPPAGFNYTTTAGSPGSGLDSTGRLQSGSTYAVLLNQLLTAAGASGDFSGYLIITCNFDNAHALYVATDFRGFSQGAHALVISGNRTVTPENLNN